MPSKKEDFLSECIYVSLNVWIEGDFKNVTKRICIVALAATSAAFCYSVESFSLGRESVAIQWGLDELSQALCCLKSRFRLLKKKKKVHVEKWVTAAFRASFRLPGSFIQRQLLLLRVVWWLPSLHTDPAWEEESRERRGGEGGEGRSLLCLYCFNFSL